MKIYINNDITKNEMANQKMLRDDRKNKNEELTEKDDKGRKYGFNKFGEEKESVKFFCGIKDDEVKKLKCWIPK